MLLNIVYDGKYPYYKAWSAKFPSPLSFCGPQSYLCSFLNRTAISGRNAVLPLIGCFSACGPRPPPGRPSRWSPGSPCQWWSARRRSVRRGTWSTNLSVEENQHKDKTKRFPLTPNCYLSCLLLCTSDSSSHLHPGGLLPSSDGVVLEGEFVLSDDGSAVFVSNIRHHVHVGRPHLKLSLPVDDGGERSADQERPFRVTLRGRERVSSTHPADQWICFNRQLNNFHY